MRKQALFVLMIWALIVGLTSFASAITLDENCTATILNRTVQLNHQGGFAIPNVPVVDGKYRVHIVCRTPGGANTYAVSDYFALVANGSTAVANLVPVGENFSPVSITIIVPYANPNLTSVGQSVQLNVRATLPADPNFPSVPQYRDVTLAGEGTTYTTSNAKIATVSANGLVTAVSHGQAVITARNEGAVSTVIFNIQTPVDSDADGMPDDWEIANGLNPNDPSDAGQDLDGDGLTNLQEYQYGTNPRVKDTDGDGINDGDEIKLGTNPLNPDTDGDGLLDGQEVKLGTNPLVADTDGDGIIDGVEVKIGTNPKVPNITTTVTGRIIGPDGNPVPGASAVIFQYFTGNADATGVFTIPFVPAGIGNILVQGSGISGAQLLSGQSKATAPVASALTDVGTIQLTVDSGVVFGRVTNPLGQGVSGANVVVQSGPTLAGRSTTTDALGNYRVTKQVSGPIVVVVSDPKTLLRGQTNGTLPQNGNLQLDVQLKPSGKLTGIVFGRDGKTPVGAGVSVVVNGALNATAKTDGVGRYSIDYQPLGSYTVDASDTNGNLGRTSTNIEFTGQIQKADVTFLGRGTVKLTVVDGSSNPVANASVYLYSQSIFGGSQTATTDSSGVYSFPGVFVGDFYTTAKSPITRLAGSQNGHLDSDGQTVNVSVMLQASGSIKGTVVRHDGTTKVVGAFVQLSSGLNTVTDANGIYQFDFVPTGNYTVDVTDGNTDDRGRTSSSVTQQDQIANGDVTMNGLGTVVVTVKDGSGNLVSGAQVSTTSNTSFSQTKSGTSAADGTVTLTNVLAGGVSVNATNPQNGLTGNNSATVPLNQTLNITVTLQSAGTIKGKVYGPDGATLIPNIQVRLDGRSSFTDANGAYQFNVVPAGAHYVAVIDAYGNIRAIVQNINLTQDQQVIQQDLTMVGVGTVSGTVHNPDSTPAPGLGVSLFSYAPGVGRRINAQTDVNGNYTISQVPVGNFTVSASGQTAISNLFGSTDGNLPSDGASVTADIQLTETQIAITSSFSLYDANGFLYDIGQPGSILNGYRRIFAGNFGTTQNGMFLDVISNGTPNRFTGRPFATKSLNNRELTLTQNGLAGLNVTRKIFVPRDGYFTRYIDLLSNPTASPITVDLSVTSYIRAGSQSIASVVGTSSGDASIDITDPNNPDRWVLLDDQNDNDPFLSPDSLVVQPVGFVFDGANAADRAKVATFDNSTGTGVMQYGWKSITIQPGQTVGYLHFVFQQTSRNGGQASATRLEAMAPEALGGESLPALSNSLTDTIAKWAAVKTSADDALASFNGAANSFATTHDQLVAYGTQLQSASDALAALVTAGNASIPQIQTQAAALKTLTAQVRDFLLSLPTKPFCLTGSANCTTTVQQGAPLLVNQGNNILPAFVLLTESSADLLDLTAVQNWNLPLGVPSALAALPSINTGALGHVYASDGNTPIVNATVSVQSVDPIFGRIYNTTSDGNGNYQLSSILRDNGDSIAIPFENFNVQATHPLSKIQSPQLLVVPNESSQTGSQDIVFSNTGIITGIVRRANGPVVSIGYVTVNGDGLAAGPAFPQIQQDGSYSVNGLPPGSYSMVATVPHPQGTPLFGATSGTIAAGLTTQADIFIQATGAITGVIKRTNGNTVPNLTIQLHGQNFVRTTQTDTGGKFTFTDVPVGSAYTLDVFDNATNSADSERVTVSADITTTKNLTLTSGGTVTGSVLNPDNTPAKGLTVTLTSPGGQLTALTDSTTGVYRFDHVTPGSITVNCVDPNTGFRGGNTGSFGLAGQVVQLDIKLYANGTVTGTVLEADNSTAVPNAQVTLYAPYPLGTVTSTADGTGKFTFNGVPIGSFTLDAAKANGDRGRSNNQVSINGETRTVNVRLQGVGTVAVTVKDAAGATVNNAHVQISSGGTFGGFQEGDTAQGVITFNNVPAVNFSIFARDNLTGLAGNANGTVTANQTQSVTVQLQPAGSITGLVQQTVNGVLTPVGGVTVRLFQYGYYQRQSTSAPDGSFRFDSVPLGNNYSLDALDLQNRVRARETGLALNSNGDIAVRNLTFIGLGTVSGQVFNPNNQPAGQNLQVQLRSLNSVIGGYFYANTDQNGQYTISGVPIGNFTVSSQDNANGYLGDASGSITQDGQSATADIHLLNDAINLPITQNDANGAYYQIQPNGSVMDGLNSIYNGDGSTNRGGFKLSLFDTQGNETAFDGNQIGVKEINGQQVDIRQTIAGIDVTRKIYVPQDGYFVRYLEILTNPGASPITVDLQIVDNHYCYYYSGITSLCPTLYTTSSGDANLDVSDPSTADRWLVMGKLNNDAYQNYLSPGLAYIYDGPNAATRASSATIDTLNSYYADRRFIVRWNSITVPAGGKVAYLHFGVTHSTEDNAQGSAERLVQLPPEALVGLSGDDITAIQNFNVPSNGVSDVPALPAITGVVSGIVYGGDGSSPVAGAPVQFTSSIKPYGRTRYIYYSDGNGAYSITGNPSSQIAVPIAPFSVMAQSPQGYNFSSPVFQGDFQLNQTSAVQNITFTNAGTLKGTIRYNDLTPVANGGSVRAQKSNPSYYDNRSIDVLGNYLLPLLPAGTYSVTASATVPSGSSLNQTVNNVSLTAGQTTTQDVVMNPTSTVSGMVLSGAGTGVPSLSVVLSGPVSRFVSTDAQGKFVFPLVPAGSYQLYANEPNTGIRTTVSILVLAGQDLTQNLQLISIGSVTLTAKYAGGSPVTSGYAYTVLNGSTQQFLGYFDSAGTLTTNAFPVGNGWSIRAYDYNLSSYLYADAPVNLVNNGDSKSVTITLPGTGVVTGTVKLPDGTPMANASMYITIDNGNPYLYYSTTTDALGAYTFTQILANGTQLHTHVYDTRNNSWYRDVYTTQLNQNGQTLTQDITMPAAATLHVLVNKSDNTPYGGVSIQLKDAFRGFRTVGTTDATAGTLDIPNVPEGDFAVKGTANGTNAGTAAGTIQSTDHGKTVNVTINAPFSVNVSGKVFAGDGTTPLYSTYVELYDASSTYQGYRYTGADGSYSFQGAVLGTSFFVRAYTPSFSTYIDTPGTATMTGQTVTVNVTLPVAVVKGTVKYSDGTPAPYPNVFVHQVPTGASYVNTYYSYTSNPDGTYSVYGGLSAGDLVLFAQDNDSGMLQISVPGNLATASTVLTLDVTLPADGTIAGTVNNAFLNGSGCNYLGISSAKAPFGYNYTGYYNSSGAFSVPHMPIGNFTVQVSDGGCSFFANTPGTLANAGDTATVNPTLPNTGTINATVKENGTPLANVFVAVQSFDGQGPRGFYDDGTDSDANGKLQMTTVPFGLIRMTAEGSNPGFAEFDLNSTNTPLDFTLDYDPTLFKYFNFILLGADGYQFTVLCDGAIADGRNMTTESSYVFSRAFRQRVNGQTGRCFESAMLDANGRQVVMGHENVGGLQLLRKVFSPAEGGFVRIMDTYTNTTGSDIKATIAMSSQMNWGEPNTVIVDPSTNNNAYTVFKDYNSNSYPPIGMVFGGIGTVAGTASVNSVFIPQGTNFFDSYINYQWEMTIPAGQTITLLNYGLVGVDSATATQAADSLAKGTTTHQFDAMTTTEKQQTVNFTVPAN